MEGFILLGLQVDEADESEKKKMVSSIQYVPDLTFVQPWKQLKCIDRKKQHQFPIALREEDGKD